jgi:chemotaxis protein MotB
MAKKKEHQAPGVPEWVLTYGDLMSLLLCFFILLAAFSELKQPREYREALEAIKEALGFEGGLGIAIIRERLSNTTVMDRPERAQRDGQLKNTDVQNEDNTSGRHPRVSVVHDAERAAIGGSIQFDVGTAELNEAAKAQLRSVAAHIRGRRFVVAVVGHAYGRDDKGMSGLDLHRLGFERAMAAVDFLVRECDVDPRVLRPESAAQHEPVAVGGVATAAAGDAGGNRRVQLYETGRTIDQVHPDPDYSGLGD